MIWPTLNVFSQLTEGLMIFFLFFAIMLINKCCFLLMLVIFGRNLLKDTLGKEAKIFVTIWFLDTQVFPG